MSEIEEKTDALVQRIDRHNTVREYVFNGDFLFDLIKSKLPSMSREDLFDIQVSVQEKIAELEEEEAQLYVESEAIKSEVAKQAARASEEGSDYPTYSRWKTSVRKTYTYDEDAILQAADQAGVPREDLYKVTRKFDPSLVLKTDVSPELKDAIKSNKLVSKATATVKWKP